MLYIIEVKHSQLVRTYKKPYQLVVIMGQTLVSKPAKLGMSELSGSQKLCFLSMDICLIFMVITIVVDNMLSQAHFCWDQIIFFIFFIVIWC